MRQIRRFYEAEERRRRIFKADMAEAVAIAFTKNPQGIINKLLSS